MAIWTEYPDKAWRDHILPHANDVNWINRSRNIVGVGLKMRELFALVILAHIYNKDCCSWVVGYDPDQGEPNDGLITDGDRVIRIEHKVIVDQNPGEVLDEILETYRRHSPDKKGANYGKDRTLIIQPNKEPSHGGLVKISDLTNEIADTVGQTCSFDRVLTLNQFARATNGGEVRPMAITQHHPKIDGTSMAQVQFHTPSGGGDCIHCEIDL